MHFIQIDKASKEAATAWTDITEAEHKGIYSRYLTPIGFAGKRFARYWPKLISIAAAAQQRRTIAPRTSFDGTACIIDRARRVNEHLRLTRVWHLKLTRPLGVYAG